MENHSHEIKSYVRRSVRVSPAQREAYQRLWPRWCIPFGRETTLDWTRLFPDCNRRVVEIGFGMGNATRQVAKEHYMWGILGIDVHKPGVGKLLWWIEQENLTNIRIVEHNAVEVIRHMIAPNSVDAFHIWFPDPWPKKRHHKRRLLQAPFARQLCTALAPGGLVHVATDWDPYARNVLSLLESHPQLQNTAERWSPRPPWRPKTKFEERAEQDGRTVRDIVFTFSPCSPQ